MIGTGAAPMRRRRFAGHLTEIHIFRKLFQPLPSAPHPTDNCSSQVAGTPFFIDSERFRLNRRDSNLINAKTHNGSRPTAVSA